MSADTEMVGWAIAIISNVDFPEAGWPNQTDEWRKAARSWLDSLSVDSEEEDVNDD
jgi:hypothetical protein